MNDSHPNQNNLSSAASIVLSLWFSLSGLAAVTGNAIVLWLFYKNETLRTISNWFLASLSVADVLVGFVLDPFWIVIRCWIQPRVHNILFDIRIVLWVHTTTATAFNVCCVSIDRFIAIRFPFRYQDILTKRRCFAVIILVWFISLSLPSSLLFFQPGKYRRKLFMFFAYTASVVPLFVVSFCYTFIFKLARKQFRSILGSKKPLDSGENSRVRAMQNLKAIKTVGFVLGTCIITWMPFLVVLLFKSCNMKEKRKYNKIRPWVEAITFTSSAINPLIYYFRNCEFHRTFRRTFHWLPCLHKSKQNPPDLREQLERNQVEQKNGTRGNLASYETKL